MAAVAWRYWRSWDITWARWRETTELTLYSLTAKNSFMTVAVIRCFWVQHGLRSNMRTKSLMRATNLESSWT